MNTPLIEPVYSPSDKPMMVAVLLSGMGTNFISIYEEGKRLAGIVGKRYATIGAVFTNVPGCAGALKAAGLGIPVLSLSSKLFFSSLGRNPDDDEGRDYYDAAAVAMIEDVCRPDLIVLAGYRRRLGGMFLGRYRNRVINLYPGDITKGYLVKGVDASVQAIRAGEGSIKCTVYLERESERFGPAMVQSEPISLAGYKEGDAEAVNGLIRSKGEWLIYPYAVHNLIAGGRLGVDGDDNVYLDGKMLGKDGFQYRE
ncbi:MAG TPA: formyltransferase family protein [Thermodesulfobacteriota bacterium]|nr:formyltransferase family protein [Thermodesulfobacteriota bacterium]